MSDTDAKLDIETLKLLMHSDIEPGGATIRDLARALLAANDKNETLQDSLHKTLAEQQLAFEDSPQGQELIRLRQQSACGCVIREDKSVAVLCEDHGTLVKTLVAANQEIARLTRERDTFELCARNWEQAMVKESSAHWKLDEKVNKLEAELASLRKELAEARSPVSRGKEW